MRKFTLMMAVLLTALTSFAQEGTEYTFSFENQEVSSSKSTAGDITADLELFSGDVTMVVTPSGANTPNRFWQDYNSGTNQLRMYGGTQTFSVPEGHALTKIVFAYGKWNDGNSADGGYMDGATWTGNAQSVVITFAGNTQINSIVCTMDGEPGTESGNTNGLVTLPEGVVAEDWAIDGVFQTQDGNESVVKATQVAFDGTDIYVQGLAYYFPEAWLKGTVSNGKVTIPSGQFVGEDDYGKEYMMGTTTGKDVVDIEFTYDADAKTLTLDNYIAESESKTAISAYGYWISLQLYAGEPILPETVTVPEGLETSEYLMTATDHVDEYDDEYNYVGTTEEPYQSSVIIGFDGKDVYIQRLCTYLPEAWAKGTLSDDGKTITIPAAQYMGKYETWMGDYDFYITDADTETGELKDVVFNYDQDTNTLTTSQMFFSGNKSMLSSMGWYTNVTMTKLNEVAATPQDPSIDNFVGEGSYPYVEMTIPTKGTNGEDLLTTKLFYQLFIEKDGTQQALTLTTDKYEMLAEDMTEIPYNFSDDWDIYAGGSGIYLEQGIDELKTWTKFGVQSIYRGMGVENKSNIVWKDLTEYWESLGISNVNALQGTARYFNLQGREVSASAKGLVIKQLRQSDGSLKTVKVVNK